MFSRTAGSRERAGFTLIELMIVVAIIAILALIAIPQYRRYVERSRNAAVDALLHQLMTSEIALQTEPGDNPFVLVNGHSPADLAELERLSSYGFRPDSRVGFVVLEAAAAAGEPPGIIAFAAFKTVGARLFVYDNISRQGVELLPSGYVFPASYGDRLFIYKLAGGTVAPGGSLAAAGNQVTAVAP